jgi:hypothetical protein
MSALAVLGLHHAFSLPVAGADTGLRPVPQKPAITYTGPITTGPTPTPPPDPGGSP